MLWLNWYDPHGYPALKTGIRVRYRWKLRAVDPFIPNRQNASSPLEHRGQLRGSVLKASHTQSMIPMVAQRLSSATSSFWIPHFGRMTWSRPLHKPETTTFAFSATSVRYRPRASHEQFLDYCNSMLQGTLQYNIAKLQHVQNSLARVVLCATWNTHSYPLLATGNALALGATSHDINKISLLVFKACRVRSRCIWTPDWLLTNQIERTFFVDYIGEISKRQQPRKL